MKQKEFFELAAEMEKECGDWENSKGLSDKARLELFAKVEALEKESKEKERKGPERKVLRLKKRYIVVLAAALVLLMGTGVVGDRAWIADSRDLERESEVTTKVDTEEKEDILREEEEIYREIAETLGIAPIRLGYKPDGMVLDSYTIAENTGWAYVYYLYDEKLISIQMIKKSKESSSNIQWDGEFQKIQNITNDHGYAENIEAYCTDDENGNYGATISYGNGYYDIYGIFPNEQVFLDILNGIYFKNL